VLLLLLLLLLLLVLHVMLPLLGQDQLSPLLLLLLLPLPVRRLLLRRAPLQLSRWMFPSTVLG
jgi:hypothetical protein